MDKNEVRNVFRGGMRGAFCVRDIICAKKILSYILESKKPRSYKYYNGKLLRYVANNSKISNILLYNAMKSEVNMSYIANSLRKNKKYRIFLPKVKKIDFNIVKYHLPLVKSSFNIKEPKGYKNHNNIIIDIAIIPILGACFRENFKSKFVASAKSEISDFSDFTKKDSKNSNVIESKVSLMTKNSAKKAITNDVNIMILNKKLQKNFTQNIQNLNDIDSNFIVESKGESRQRFSQIRFSRIGFGKGMYDRFYKKARIKPKCAFVSRFMRLTSSPVCEPHDIESSIYFSVYNKNVLI